MAIVITPFRATTVPVRRMYWSGAGPGFSSSSSDEGALADDPTISAQFSPATALVGAEKFLGAGYKEIAPGIFRSADGLRQFRMTPRDLLPAPGNIGPHVHFEALNKAGQVIENLHLPVLPKSMWRPVMRLRAKVSGSTGKTRHSIGDLVDGTPMPVENVQTPEWVEISEEDGAYYLFHLDAEGVCFADTWHQTLEEAKQQAAFEFGIEAKEWSKA
jgi:hypothetical protein